MTGVESLCCVVFVLGAMHLMGVSLMRRSPGRGCHESWKVGNGVVVVVFFGFVWS